MLEFSLGELQILCSERQDGSFRLAPKKVFAALQQHIGKNFAYHCSHLRLLHGERVVEVGQQKTGKGLSLVTADALLTVSNPEQQLLSLVVGDCFPLVFFDQKTENFALIHAGRKSLSLGIVAKTVSKLLALPAVKVANLRVWLGPGIRKESYWIPIEPEQRVLPDWQDFIQRQEGSWQIDLPGFIIWQLLELGLGREQILDSGLDTYQLQEQFFSHRRAMEGEDQEDGRFLLAAFLPQRKN